MSKQIQIIYIFIFNCQTFLSTTVHAKVLCTLRRLALVETFCNNMINGRWGIARLFVFLWQCLNLYYEEQPRRFVLFIKTAVSQINSSVCAQNSFKISVKEFSFSKVAPLRTDILQNIELFYSYFSKIAETIVEQQILTSSTGCLVLKLIDKQTDH